MKQREKWVYDLESFPTLFALGFRNPKTGETKLFEISQRKNNSRSARKFLRTRVSVLIGFNTMAYDSFLIDYFLNTKVTDPAQFNKISVRTINGNRNNYTPTIPNVDLFKILHFDNKNKRTSLKYCEFGLKMPVVQDLPYPFDKHLTYKETQNVMDYLVHDLDATHKLYDHCKDKIYLRAVIQRDYGLKCLNWSDSKIGEKLLLKLYCEETGDDPEVIVAQRTGYRKVLIGDMLPDYLEFKVPEFIKAHESIRDIYLDKNSWSLEHVFYHNDIKYKIGLGGIHSTDIGIWRKSDKLLLHDEDVASYYPSLLIQLGICPSHLNAKAFLRVIKEKLVEPRSNIHKPKSKDKTLHWKTRKDHAAFSDMLKLAANSVTGNLKNTYSWLYDPAENARMTLAGQMSLLMLIDMIAQKFPDMHFLQSNTDGFTMTYSPEKHKEVKKICTRWESITGLVLEDAYPNAIYQRDGNDYIWEFESYNKLKGAYEVDKKVGSEVILNKDSSKKIVAIAVREYFINGTPIEDTIKNHDDIYDFCIGKKNKKAQKKGACYFEYQASSINNRLEIKQTKVLRYYVSNSGGIIRKIYEDGSETLLEAYPKSKVQLAQLDEWRGHASDQRYWKLRMFNKYKEKTMEQYNIDYSYYLREANKLIYAIEKHTLQPEEATGE